MPMILATTVPTPENEVRDIFNLFDFGLDNTISGTDVLRSALSSLLLKPKQAELTAIIGDALKFDVSTFITIVKTLEASVSPSTETKQAFQLFGEGARTLETSHFKAVHEELGWDFDAEKNAAFIKDASAGGEFNYKVWHRVIHGEEEAKEAEEAEEEAY